MCQRSLPRQYLLSFRTCLYSRCQRMSCTFIGIESETYQRLAELGGPMVVSIRQILIDSCHPSLQPNFIRSRSRISRDSASHRPQQLD